MQTRLAIFNTARMDHLSEDPHAASRRFILLYGDMTGSSSLFRVMHRAPAPDQPWDW